MTDVKLLTEAEWRKLLAPHPFMDDVIAAIALKGLIAREQKPVDPLLLNAREMTANWYRDDPEYPDGFYNGDIDAVMAGEEDGPHRLVGLVIAALRRGMELQREAQPPLTRERLDGAIDLVQLHNLTFHDINVIHAALTGEA